MATTESEKPINYTEIENSLLGLLNVTMDNNTISTTEAPSDLDGPLPIIISLVCIFLLLATCLVFVTLCKPAALDQSLYGPRECMPYHTEDSSEPQLRLWKRLGSLRCSVTSFRRSRPVSQLQRTCSRNPPIIQDWPFMESTKM